MDQIWAMIWIAPLCIQASPCFTWRDCKPARASECGVEAQRQGQRLPRAGPGSDGQTNRQEDSTERIEHSREDGGEWKGMAYHIQA